MKTNWFKQRTATCVIALMMTATGHTLADESAAAAGSDKTYTGTVTAIDSQEHVLTVTSWGVWKKSFNLGENCTYKFWDKDSGTLNDLRPGEKVAVSYQDAHGVLIAGRVEQQPMQFEGMVKAIDLDKHTLILHRSASDKQVQIADDCKIRLRDGKSGTWDDVSVGNHVTITYETPAGELVAREIAQTSMEFTGKLTAVDLEDKTVKIRSGFETKKFMLANHCAIVTNGKPDGNLADLKPNDKLVLSYDEINGVNVVNRIAPIEPRPGPVANVATPMADN